MSTSQCTIDALSYYINNFVASLLVKHPSNACTPQKYVIPIAPVLPIIANITSRPNTNILLSWWKLIIFENSGSIGNIIHKFYSFSALKLLNKRKFKQKQKINPKYLQYPDHLNTGPIRHLCREFFISYLLKKKKEEFFICLKTKSGIRLNAGDSFFSLFSHSSQRVCRALFLETKLRAIWSLHWHHSEKFKK